MCSYATSGHVSTTKPLSRHSHFFAAAALAAILHGVSTTKPLSRHSHNQPAGRPTQGHGVSTTKPLSRHSHPRSPHDRPPRPVVVSTTKPLSRHSHSGHRKTKHHAGLRCGNRAPTKILHTYNLLAGGTRRKCRHRISRGLPAIFAALGRSQDVHSPVIVAVTVPTTI